MLEIRLFGPPTLHLNGQDLRADIPEQVSAILCYLILNRERPLHRDTVVGHFWTESSQEKARKALRTAIWRIRLALEEEGDPPILLTESEYVRFNTEIPYWLDIQAFKLFIEEARKYEEQAQPDAAMGALKEAVRLYRADLLEGWTDEWLLYARMHLESLYLTALTDLMIYHSSLQEFQPAIQYGMLILHHDPLLESIQRHLMRLHYWAGNRAAAVRQYQQCQEHLARELGVEPMEETRRLFENICNENISALALHDSDLYNQSSTRPAGQNTAFEAIIRRLKTVQDELYAVGQQLELATTSDLAS